MIMGKPSVDLDKLSVLSVVGSSVMEFNNVQEVHKNLKSSMLHMFVQFHTVLNFQSFV